MTSSSSASSGSSSGAVTTPTAAVENTLERSRFSIGSTVRVCVPTPIHTITTTTTTGSNSNGRSHSNIITISRRAIVATLSNHNHSSNDNDDDDHGQDTLSLVLDDPAPRPLVRGASPFLIAPLFRSRGRAAEDFECRVEDVRALLPFELEESFGGSGAVGTSSSSSWSQLRRLALLRKSHGDELFRLKDYSSAIGYYEAALGVISAKSRLAVGGSCVARRKGRAAVAEVDCVEREAEEEEEKGEGETMVGGARRIGEEKVKYDVTFLDEEGMPYEEECISDKDVILAIWEDDEQRNEQHNEQQDEQEDHEDHARFLQIRILLNLSRSLLRLASADRTRGSGSCFGDRPSSRSSPSPSNRRDKYLSSAIVGCTAAISLCRYHGRRRIRETLSRESTSLEETALLIRANARFEMGIDQFPKAMRDARRIVETAAPSEGRRRQAAELMNEIECAKRCRRRLDRKLSRDVCRWVQTSMNEHGNGSETSRGGGNARDDDDGDERPRSSDGNGDTARASVTDSVSASDCSGSGIDDADRHDRDDDNGDDSLERWYRPSDSISGRREGGNPSRDEGMHSCDGSRSGNFFWVSKRRIDVDVVGVLAFIVAMWIVYSQ